MLSLDDQTVAYVQSGTLAVVTPSQTATYTLTVSNSSGQSVTAQVLVTVVPLPTIVEALQPAHLPSTLARALI